MILPDTEQLCTKLIEELRPVITPRTAMVGIYTGGLWLASNNREALRCGAGCWAINCAGRSKSKSLRV